MANRHRGEVGAHMGGEQRTLCLTLGALADLEDRLGADDVASLAERLGSGRLSARDMTAILAAGLRGAGSDVTEADVAAMTLDGGAVAAVKAVTDLLEATFGGRP